MKNEHSVIIGANSEIAKAIAEQLYSNSLHAITVISRDLHFYKNFDNNRVKKISINDYSAATINKVIENMKKEIRFNITQVFICTGILHQQDVQPEKRLEDFSDNSFEQIMAVNALLPILWIKNLNSILSKKAPCKIVVFSARVGSIEDNKLGGWYSYRASKAALNMMLKSASIELARRSKNLKLIAFHPGTTDTPLSKPFQKNVAEGKLFPADFVASQLIEIVKNAPMDNRASFLDWQGKTIPW